MEEGAREVCEDAAVLVADELRESSPLLEGSGSGDEAETEFELWALSAELARAESVGALTETVC